MSKPWAPHDVGGLKAGPVDTTDHDIAYWEWQIDAMIRLALKKDLISDFAELRDGIERLAPGDYSNLGYYERWAKSLAYTLVSRGIVDQAALDRQVTSVRKRQEAEGVS